MLKRVKRKTSKQQSIDKSEDSMNISETEALTQVIQELKSEVKGLKEQLENEKRNSSEIKSIKTQQICTLTFKLANAVRQRERTEEEVAKLQEEIKQLKDIIQNQEKRLNEKEDLEGRIQDEQNLTALQQKGNEEAAQLSETPKLEKPADDEDSVDFSLNSLQCSAVENNLEQLQRGFLEMTKEGDPDPVAHDSFRDDDFSKEQQHQEAEISPPDAVCCNEPYSSSTDYNETTQECKETIAQEFNKIQREMHEIKANMSCVQQMNHCLAENLKTFAKTQKRMLDGKDLIALNDGNDTDEDNHFSLPFPTESPGRECVGIGPDKENKKLSEHLPEDKNFAQKAEHDGFKNIPEEEADIKTLKATEKFGDVETVTPLNEMLTKPECENTRTVVKENSDNGKLETIGFATTSRIRHTTHSDSSFLNVSEKVENLKQQLTQALREIEKLRLENEEMKAEIRKISTPGEGEADKVLREMTGRTDHLPISRRYSPGETYNHSLNFSRGGHRWLTTPTKRDMRRWRVAPVAPPRRNSLPLRVISARLEEITRSVEDLAMSTLADEETLLQELECADDFVNRERDRRQYGFGLEPFIYTPADCFQRSTVARNLVYKKVDEERFCPSTRSQQLIQKEKPQTERKFKPVEQNEEVGNCGRVNRLWKSCFSDPPDHIQRYIVRSSEHIAKMRDLKPEELPFYIETG